MNTIVSTDAKRSVTLHTPAETVVRDASGIHFDGEQIVPDTKRKYVVSATTATGGLRTWQVTSKVAVSKIKAAYAARGGRTLVTGA